MALALIGSNEHNQRSSVLERSVQGRSSDQWASIVDAVKQRRKENKGQRALIVTSQIAAKIRNYWEGMAVKQEKVRVAEEKRLRTLAK